MAPNGVKRRKIEHDSSSDESDAQVTSKSAQKAFFKNASSWDLEQDYETRPRKGKKQQQQQQKRDFKESTRLPLKDTSNGRVEILRGIELEDEVDDESVESDAEWLEGRDDHLDDDSDSEKKPAEPEKSDQEQIREAQEELAKIATAVNENPEDNVGAFKALAKIGQSKITTIKMLTLMTQMTVYKDVIPGYRIRPLSEQDAKEKLSKEVRQLRAYEQSLIAGYQGYIKELARCARIPQFGRNQSLSTVAITCACTLITSVPHFNFRGDLLSILVRKLSRRFIDEQGKKCLEAMETLFRDDEEGRPSMEAVALLSKMMKARDYNVHESVLNLFLSLRLLSEFAGKASHDHVERERTPKITKKNREFRTKRDRKAMKEQKGIEKELSQADALVNHEENERMQSKTLKLVFATYFRVLKARVPHLMGAVLEGLAKYAHLINQDFFGDLLEALKDLIRHSMEDAEGVNENAEEEDDEQEEEDEEDDEDDDMPTRNLTREALLCTVTAYALLAGQDANKSKTDLHLDLSYFTSHLYTSLLALSVDPDLELTKPPAATSSTSKINVQTTTVLLLRSLTAILLPPYNIRSVPPTRLAAFTKQLSSTALQLPEKSCQGVLALLDDVLRTHGKKVASLWNTEERKGDGRYNPLSNNVEGSNPFTATIWEGELLRKHYSPKVREGVKLLEKGISR